MGFCVLAGLFEPGTAVRLFAVSNDGRTVRVGGGEPLLGHRLADKNGSVGFDGLEPLGQLCIAQGVDVFGNPVEIRVRVLGAGDGSELAQPPVAAVPQKVGTQEADPVQEPVGSPRAILHVGVPAGLPLGVVSNPEE